MTRALQILIAASCVMSCSSDGDGQKAGRAGPPLRNPPTYTIGGSITGLRGTGLVLQNNGGDPLSVDANGPFTFATSLDAPYSVTVLTQPTATPAETCSVADGSGFVGNTAVTNVTVTCRALTGKFLYATSGLFSGPSTIYGISGFSIDPITGALTEIPEARLAIDLNPDRQLHVDKAGKFLFFWVAAGLAGYAIDSATGVLTPVPGTPYRLPPVTINSMFFHPNGRVLYLAAGSTASTATANPQNGVYAYSIDPTTGVLTPVPGSPYRLPQDLAAASVASNDAGTTVLVRSLRPPRASVFAADATTGALTLQGSADLPRQTTGIFVHPDGRYAYVPFGDNSLGSQLGGDLGVLGIENPGAITVTVVPVTRQFFRLRYLMLDNSGHYLYLLDDGFLPIGGGGSYMHAYRVDIASGALTPLAGSPYATHSGAFEPVMDSTGRYIVAPQNPIGLLLTFEIDPTTGELRHLPGSPFPLTSTAPQGLALDPSGRFAYVADGSAFSVSAYSIDLAEARFAFINSYPLGRFVSDVRIAGLQ